MALDPCAHLLLQVDPGRADEAASYLASLPSVAQATVTSGPYDVIARVQVVDLTDEAVARVVAQAKRTPGLCGLRVCRSA